MSLAEYNKLVRDKIPEVIQASGKTCETEILSEAEYLKMLDAKLDEELAEYHKDQNIEELADLLEVIYAAAKARGYTVAQLEHVRQKKAEERGGFEKRILLKSVIDPNVGTDLLERISHMQKEIMGKITENVLQKYLWIQDNYLSRNLSADLDFRKRFGSYYRMRYVSQEYRDRFFALFEEIKHCENPDFIEVSRKLFAVDRHHQFSFISKMLHTIDPTRPIYDSQVDTVLQLHRSYQPDIEKKLQQDAELLRRITSTYDKIKNAPVVLDLCKQMDQLTSGQSISMEKKLDFILWALGGI